MRAAVLSTGRLTSACSLAAALLVAACAHGRQEDVLHFVPAGWTSIETSALEQDWRREDPLRFAVAHGDYDGDGRRDEARLVRSEDGRTVALAIFLSGDRAWRVVRDWPVAEIERLGVRRAHPGVYETACGKGTYDCAPGEPQTVTVSGDAVEWFYFEGMSQLVYFDERSRMLRAVTLSD